MLEVFKWVLSVKQLKAEILAFSRTMVRIFFSIEGKFVVLVLISGHTSTFDVPDKAEENIQN